MMAEKDDTDWKAIALALAQRVNFAMTSCSCGSGALFDVENGTLTSWRVYMAEAMEMVPGVSVDREIMGTLDLPLGKRKKAQAAIKASRAALLPDNAEVRGRAALSRSSLSTDGLGTAVPPAPTFEKGEQQ
jgi:hypothetical protein